MCGRFVLFTSPRELGRVFDAEGPGLEIRPDYNVAPGRSIPVVLARGGSRNFSLRHWGLVPFWAKDTAIGARMINARVETLASKPAFKAALKARRCLIPADGFYEWKGRSGNKQPYYFHADAGGPLAFAGLYETREDPDAGPYESCTIVTTAAVGPVSEIHHRMPVILAPAAWAEWLDPDLRDPERAIRLIEAHHRSDRVHRAVSKQVNNAARNSPELIVPIEDGPGAATDPTPATEGSDHGRAE